jgi:hypothetical protein
MRPSTMLFPLGLFVLLFPTLAAAEPAELTQKVQGEMFSYSIPADWETKRLEGVKHIMAFSPAIPGQGHQANVNYTSESFQGTAREYAAIAIKTLQKDQPQLKLLDMGPFITDIPTLALRVVWDNKFGERELRQTTYIFMSGGQAHIFTSTVGKGDAVELGPVLDRIARTFEVENAAAPAEQKEVNRTLLSTDGAAALTTPDTWHVTWEQNSPDKPKYQMARPAAENDDFFVNSIMSVDAHDGTPDEYLRDLMRGLPQSKLVERAAFRTAQGETGARAMLQTKAPDDRTVTQALFVFSSGKNKYVVVCSTSNAQPAEDLKFFDQMVRDGFHWRKP